MPVWFSWGFVCIQLYLLHGMLFPSLSYFLISDCARQSPGKHSRLFWEPRQFFELVGILRQYSLFATSYFVSFTGFPFGFSTLFVIFQGSSAWLHYPSNGFVACSPSALQLRSSIVTIFITLLTLMWPSIF